MRPPDLPWLIAGLAVLVAAAAIAVPAIAGGDGELKRVVVQNVSDSDPTDDKEIQAQCPDGYQVVGGGGGIPGDDDTASVALYQSYPVGQSWLVTAHETNPKPTDESWDLYATAICAKVG